MQLFFSLVVLPQIRVLIRKLVKVMHKFVQDSLLAVGVVQEVQKLMLDVSSPRKDLFALCPEVLKDLLHLDFVVYAQILPK